MERCPVCGQTYTGMALRFCRKDGAQLVHAQDTSSPPSTSRGTEAPTLQFQSEAASIAVLPFVHMSADPDDEFFCEGLAEEIINALSKIEGLKVAARTSAFYFKGKEVQVNEIGRALSVDKVLEGSVRKSGDRLRITVQLIDAAKGYHLWSERYDRRMEDVFEIQDEITLSVVEALKVKLLGGEKAAVLKRHTVNAEAYQFYLRGRHFWNRRTANGTRKALEQFQQAIDADPNYALAYVGLADCYILMEQVAGAPAGETILKAKAAALRALERDGSLAEGHTSLAAVHDLLWQWGEAEEEYRRSFSLNPNYPTAHHWHARHLRLLGRYDEALSGIKRAQELDPLSPSIAWNVVFDRLLNGEVEAIVEECKRIIELDPRYPLVPRLLGSMYLREGRFDDAVLELQRAVDLSGGTYETLSYLGHGYAFIGQRGEAEVILKRLLEQYTRAEATGASIAMVYVGLRDTDRAFHWLNKDLQKRSGILPGWLVDPNFDTLRVDSRFAELRRGMNLPR